MPWPPQDDTLPTPPQDVNGRRSFTPLVKIAMRMGWIEDAHRSTPNGLMPMTMGPFSYIAAHEEDGYVYVFGVVRGTPMNWKESSNMFPNDSFIGRLQLLI